MPSLVSSSMKAPSPSGMAPERMVLRTTMVFMPFAEQFALRDG